MFENEETTTSVQIHQSPARPGSGAYSLKPLLVLPVLALLSACAGQGLTKTGFISSYDGMKATKQHSYDLTYVNPAYVPANYSKVIIDPVVWDPAPGTPKRNPEEIGRLEAAFSKSLNERLAKNYTIVAPPPVGSTPPPGVLRIRTAVTNTRKAHWWINAPVQAAGVAGIAFGVPGVPPPDPGGASEEMEVLDANTGQRVAAIATYNNGKPWNPLGFYEDFGHARLAFSKASDLLRDELQAKPVT